MPEARRSSSARLTGDPSPSAEDEVIAKRLISGSELLGLQFLDSVIVGDGRYYSFRESGLIGR